MRKTITLFMWGYCGWGNVTPQLVKAVDAVEKSRSFKPPLFVDIRIRREVRAKGFIGDAFKSVVGKRRYKWVPDLGNETILTGGSRIRIRKPSVANDLLNDAVKLAKHKQRIIFYCSCEFPYWTDDLCHRTTVAKLVLKYAREQKRAIEVVEWPGGNPQMIDVQVSDEDFKKLGKNQKSIPLDNPRPLAKFAGLPWGSIARVHTLDNELLILTGPAKCRKNGDWYLPVMRKTYAANYNAIKLKRKAETLRKKFGFEPLKRW